MIPSHSCFSLDYRRLFARGLYEELDVTLSEHGIDTIYEDVFEDIVSEATDRWYLRTIAEFRKMTGQEMIPYGELACSTAVNAVGGFGKDVAASSDWSTMATRYPRPKRSCPYCNGKNLRVKQWQRFGTWFVACQDCNATGPGKAMTPQEACDLFDKRAEKDEQEEFSFI